MEPYSMDIDKQHVHLVDLPNEIIDQIFTFLPYYDLITMTTLCSKFTNNFTFLQRTRIKLYNKHPITKNTFSESDLNKIFELTSRHYQHFEIHSMSPSLNINKWIEKFGSHIKSLVVELLKTSLELKDFLHFLSLTPNIEEIQIKEGLNYDDAEMLHYPALRSVKKLHFAQNSNYDGGAKLCVFLKVFTANMKLEKILFDTGDVNLFMDKVFTILNMFKHAKIIDIPSPENYREFFSACISLTDLKLSNDFEGFEESEEKYMNNFKLKTFEYHSYSFDDDCIDSCIEAICSWKSFKNLESLTLQLESEISEERIKLLSNLKALKNLVLRYEYDDTPDASSSTFLVGITLPHLRKLTMEDEALSSANIILISKQFPNLVALNLRECEKGVINRSLRSICSKLTLLEDLNLEYCEKLTDAGFIKLNKLKKLKMLNLNWCENIEGRFLKNTNLPNLLSLQMTQCLKKVPTEEYKIFSKNSPNLEEFNLSCNSSIDDEIIEAITGSFLRLQNLTVESLNSVTDNSVESIIKNCACLKVLRMTDCAKISLTNENVFKRMPQLRYVSLEN